MAKDVFISYSHVNEDVANAIVKHFEANGISCFIDREDIARGKDFESELSRGISESKAVIVVASKAMNNSKHIIRELRLAESYSKQIIPFMIENFSFAESLAYYLNGRQYVTAFPRDPKFYLDDLLSDYKSLLGILDEKTQKRSSRNESSTVVFEYIAERGMMVNPEDKQRNVSFRTDTFINMFGGIYEEVEKLSPETARDIFHKTGYTCGQNFASRLNSQWDLHSSTEEFNYEEKLKKWCEFDSKVGWGKFDVSVQIDAESGEFNGQLSIRDCFIVDKKKKRHVCEFLKGYCEGVLETLLGAEVRLECTSCPLLKHFNEFCKFNIILK